MTSTLTQLAQRAETRDEKAIQMLTEMAARQDGYKTVETYSDGATLGTRRDVGRVEVPKYPHSIDAQAPLLKKRIQEGWEWQGEYLGTEKKYQMVMWRTGEPDGPFSEHKSRLESLARLICLLACGEGE
jgi:hypothetical protein